MERDLMSRAFINILDVNRFYEYEKFSNDDLYDQLLSVMESLTDDAAILNNGKEVLNKNKEIIDKIIDGSNTYEEFQDLCEDLRSFKRKNKLLPTQQPKEKKEEETTDA